MDCVTDFPDWHNPLPARLYMIFTNPLDWLSLGFFLLMWFGYTFYAKEKAKSGTSLSARLFEYRVDWMRNMFYHENRIPDIVLVGNLTTMVNFLATTTILLLAGIVTVICSTEEIIDLLSDHAFVVPADREQIQFKLLLLGIIFVFAFFKFTWSMRQHTFCNIMLGGLPFLPQGAPLTPEHEELAKYAAKISDRAGHEFNFGLRSYYFALAVLTWFLGPMPFMATTIMVVFVLYQREFRSATLKYLAIGRDLTADIQKRRAL